MEKHQPLRRISQKRNWCLAAAIISFIALTFYGISTNIPLQILKAMSGTVDSTSSNQEIPIKVSLSPASPPSTSEVTLKLKVTLENTSPSEPVHFLRWNSPVDVHAAAVGAYTFTSMKTGEKSPGVELKINHKMPETGYFTLNDDEIVSIEAGGKVEKVVEFKQHEVLLERGETYLVKAVGSWTGVWVGEYEMLQFNKGGDVRIGDFVSDNVEVRIPG